MTPLKRKWFKRLGLGLIALLLFDIVRFWGTTIDYTETALQGMKRLPPPIPEEAIVVLTGAELRIPKAIELLKVRSSPLLIISGTAKAATLTDVANAQGDAILNIQEVWSRIVMESRSSSTRENAEESGKLLVDRSVKRVLLVTSDYHCARALSLFQNLLPQYEYVIYPVASLQDLTLDSMSRWWGEYWKYLSYRIVDKTKFFLARRVN